jgi:RNA polymerase sigma-70 factor, ECF subfamily
VTRVVPPDSERSDEALVAAASEGDVRALEALIRRHESRVLRVLRFLGIGREDREDVAQDVFLRVFRGLSGFRSGFVFESWLYRVTVNAAFDHRAGELRRTQAMEPLEGTDDTVADSGIPPHERSLLRVRLESALKALSDRERAVFVLKEIEGLDSAQVARALDLNPITVRRHLSRARERLKRILSNG